MPYLLFCGSQENLNFKFTRRRANPLSITLPINITHDEEDNNRTNQSWILINLAPGDAGTRSLP